MSVTDTALVGAMQEAMRARGRTAGTIAEYVADIDIFRGHLVATRGAGARLSHATNDDLAAWVQDLKRRYAPRTVARKICSVRQLYRHGAAAFGMADPAVGIERPPTPLDEVRRVVPRDVAMRVRDEVDLTDPRAVRDALMVVVSSELGFNSAKLIRLRCSDLATLVDKCSQDTGMLLKYYVVRCRPRLVTRPTDMLFVATRNAQLTRQGVWKAFRRTINAGSRAVAYGAVG